MIKAGCPPTGCPALVVRRTVGRICGKSKTRLPLESDSGIYSSISLIHTHLSRASARSAFHLATTRRRGWDGCGRSCAVVGAVGAGWRRAPRSGAGARRRGPAEVADHPRQRRSRSSSIRLLTEGGSLSRYADVGRYERRLVHLGPDVPGVSLVLRRLRCPRCARCFEEPGGPRCLVSCPVPRDVGAAGSQTTP